VKNKAVRLTAACVFLNIVVIFVVLSHEVGEVMQVFFEGMPAALAIAISVFSIAAFVFAVIKRQFLSVEFGIPFELTLFVARDVFGKFLEVAAISLLVFVVPYLTAFGAAHAQVEYPAVLIDIIFVLLSALSIYLGAYICFNTGLKRKVFGNGGSKRKILGNKKILLQGAVIAFSLVFATSLHATFILYVRQGYGAEHYASISQASVITALSCMAIAAIIILCKIFLGCFMPLQNTTFTIAYIGDTTYLAAMRHDASSWILVRCRLPKEDSRTIYYHKGDYIIMSLQGLALRHFEGCSCKAVMSYEL